MEKESYLSLTFLEQGRDSYQLRSSLANMNACHFFMMEKQKAVLEKVAQIFHIRHLFLQQGLAECLGTLVLVVSIRGRAGLCGFEHRSI